MYQGQNENVGLPQELYRLIKTSTMGFPGMIEQLGTFFYRRLPSNCTYGRRLARRIWGSIAMKRN